MGKYVKFKKPSYLNLANQISLIRLVLLPIFFYFLTYYLLWLESEREAGATFVYYFATIGLAPLILFTDFLDGWVARKLELVNPLGAFLDPLADKFFAFFTMALLSWAERLPVWLVLLVFFKEMFILVGWLLLFILGYDTEISPSNLGKAAVVCQGTLVFSGLLTLPGGEFFAWQSFPLYGLAVLLNQTWFHVITAVVTSLAGAFYVLEGLQRAHRPVDQDAENLVALQVEESEGARREK